MKRVGVLSVLTVGLLIAALLLRASRFTSRQVRAEPGAIVPVDASAAAERLAGALRIVTVSPEDPSARVNETFDALHAYLARSFPKVHATLRQEVIARGALL